MNPEIQILEQLDDANNLSDAEVLWISEARRMGIPLTNVLDGGEGTTGRVVSDRTRQKLRESLTGNKNAVGALWTNEVRETHGRIWEKRLSDTRFIASWAASHGAVPFYDKLGRTFQTLKEAAGVYDVTPQAVCAALKRPGNTRGFRYVEGGTNG